VSPATRGPGFARGRQRNYRCQPRRTSTATNSRGGAVPALRARIPHAVITALMPSGRRGGRACGALSLWGAAPPHTPTFSSSEDRRGDRWPCGAAAPGARQGKRRRTPRRPVAGYQVGQHPALAHPMYCGIERVSCLHSTSSTGRAGAGARAARAAPRAQRPLC
jgi:hypothetical protein